VKVCVSTLTHFFTLHVYTDAVAARIKFNGLLSNVRKMCWFLCCGVAVELRKKLTSMTRKNMKDGSRECNQAIEEQV